MTCTWPANTTTNRSSRTRVWDACEDFRLVAWDYLGPMPAVCVERPRYDFDLLHGPDQHRRGMTGARVVLSPVFTLSELT